MTIGRPLLLTPAIAERIVDSVEVGNPENIAALAAGRRHAAKGEPHQLTLIAA